MSYQAIENGKLVVDAGLIEGFVPPATLGWGLKADIPKDIWNLRGRLKELNLIGVQVHVRATTGIRDGKPAFQSNLPSSAPADPKDPATTWQTLLQKRERKGVSDKGAFSAAVVIIRGPWCFGFGASAKKLRLQPTNRLNRCSTSAARL